MKSYLFACTLETYPASQFKI